MINKEIVYLAEGIEVTLMCTLICWVYGVQNFSDDIHTMVGLQPAKYWKICWYVMPLFLWVNRLLYLHFCNYVNMFLVKLFLCVLLSTAQSRFRLYYVHFWTYIHFSITYHGHESNILPSEAARKHKNNYTKALRIISKQ